MPEGMPSYGQITGTDQRVDGSWFIELNDDGSPVSEFEFIPIEAMPDIVPVWSIALRISDEAGIAFSDDEAANLTIIKMLRSLSELKGLDAESQGRGMLPAIRRANWRYTVSLAPLVYEPSQP